MCCSISHQAQSCHDPSARRATVPFQCGCGCIGHGQAASRLENHREHLKAELRSVEDRIAGLKKD